MPPRWELHSELRGICRRTCVQFPPHMCFLSHQQPDFVEVPRAEIVSVNADIHGKGSRCVREAPMRMSVQVPRSMMGAIPDPHGVVTDHDGLAMYGDFRKVAEPRELLGQLANLLVVITRHRKDVLAANLLAVLQGLRLAPDTEVPKEIQDVIDLNGGVETVENRLIHFRDASKRSITVTDYVAMTKMKIRGEPYVRHVSCELPGDLAPFQ